jgi:hypothetical protein
MEPLARLTAGGAEAPRLYERLGFVASHEGFKLRLPGS